jgi:cell division protein FtsQ
MTEPGVTESAPEPPPRRWKFMAFLLLLVLLAPASWLARRAASRMDFFQLRSIAVEGTRYLSPETVVERLAVDTSRSVWDDTEPLAERLRTMPQVGEVEIRRRLPGTLVVAIRENLPVALAPSPRGLEPVDSAGVVLPIDPAYHDVDLPVANHRDKSILSLLTAARSQNPMLYHRISEISRDGKDAVIMQLAPLEGMRSITMEASSDSNAVESVPQHATLKVRASMGVSVSRLADIFPVESDLMRRRAKVAELDLRYRDQVIARLQ